MDEDEEIARAIRRDPRWVLRVIVVLVLTLILGAIGLSALSNLHLGERAARGFSTVTGVPPPSDAGPSAP